MVIVRLTDMDKKFIRIKGSPTEYARRAYDTGFFVEALQVLHGWIECQARGLLMLIGSVRFNTVLAETWDSVDEISYKDIIKVLLAIGQITKEESIELIQINSTRNKIIHQIFKDPYEKTHDGFPKKEYDRVFQIALFWADKMIQKNEELVV